MSFSLKHFFANRSLLIVKLVVLTWAITKCFSYALFTAGRLFPLVPVHESMLQLPKLVHAGLYWISLAGMLIFLLLPKRWLAWIVLLAELLSCLLDQNRWQPWEYQFIFMLAAWLLLSSERYLYTAWQLMLAGIYFFSGLAKLQPGFIHDIWNSLILRNWLGIYTNNQSVFRLGYLLPLAEMAGAVLLCIRGWSKPGVAILVGMHLFILLLFGPLGFNRNELIWPWNILMILLLVLLFYKDALQPERTFFRQRFAWLVVACFCVFPALRLAGLWDHYLSFTMYSGGITQLYICTNHLATLQKNSVHIGGVRNSMVPCDFPISVYQWGMRAMNSAPYPEQRVFRSIARQWMQQYPGVPVRFYLYTSGFKPTVREMRIE